MKIDETSIDELVVKANARIRELVESGAAQLSSEATYRFSFAWELGRLLSFSPEYRFDFEYLAYGDLDSDDRFLDLLTYTDPQWKVAFEFKLPKASALHGSNTTQARAKMCRDISRLGHLVQNAKNSIRRGYFLCATDEGSYINQGRKSTNVQYRTHQATTYAAGCVLPAGIPPNGIARELRFPGHDVRFHWEGVRDSGVSAERLSPSGRFAWLAPICIRA